MLVWMDPGVLRPCCHLDVVKRGVTNEIQGELKMVAHADEDLQRRAYHRFG